MGRHSNTFCLLVVPVDHLHKQKNLLPSEEQPFLHWRLVAAGSSKILVPVYWNTWHPTLVDHNLDTALRTLYLLQVCNKFCYHYYVSALITSVCNKTVNYCQEISSVPWFIMSSPFFLNLEKAENMQQHILVGGCTLQKYYLILDTSFNVSLLIFICE